MREVNSRLRLSGENGVSLRGTSILGKTPVRLTLGAH